MIFQLKKKFVIKTGAGKEAYCIKTGAGKGYLWILVQAKQCGKLALKANQSRVGGEDSKTSLARELGWIWYKVRVFGEGIEILPTSFNLCYHHWTFFSSELYRTR